MKQTLIKINEQHYIVIDDSEIKENDFIYYICTGTSLNPPKSGIYKVKKITDKIIQFYNNKGVVDKHSCKKITHSTQPDKGMENVTFISLSEVEEAINGCSLDNKIAKHLEKNHIEASSKRVQVVKSLVEELVKDKLFTVEDMRKELTTLALEIATEDGELSSCSPSLIYSWVENKIQSLLPKTEWECCISDGKLVLL